MKEYASDSHIFDCDGLPMPQCATLGFNLRASGTMTYNSINHLNNIVYEQLYNTKVKHHAKYNILLLFIV